MSEQVSSQNGIVVLILAILLGPLGVHRFMVGKIGTGVLMLLTFGGFGIWALIDVIMIIIGAFTDADGNKIKLSN